jgi:hypothetical protein
MDDLQEEVAALFGHNTILDPWGAQRLGARRPWDGFAIERHTGIRRGRPPKQCKVGHLMDRPKILANGHYRCRTCWNAYMRALKERLKSAGKLKNYNQKKDCLDCGGQKSPKQGARWCPPCVERRKTKLTVARLNKGVAKA